MCLLIDFLCTQSSFSMYANDHLDASAFSKPGDREDGATDDKHAKTLPDGSDHSFPDFHLSPSYLCVGKCSLPLSSFRRTEVLSDDLQYRCCQIPESKFDQHQQRIRSD